MKSNAANALAQSDSEQLDKAAACMVSMSRQSLCIQPHEELFCRVFCCAAANPLTGKDGRKCKQSCADALLKYYRQATANASTEGMGKAGNYFFVNSQSYTMKDPTGTKLLAGTGLSCRDWTPDISVYDRDHGLAYVYDFKFDGDSWHAGQEEAYRKLVGGEKNNVMEINSDSCQCSAREELANAESMNDAAQAEIETEKQKMIAKMHETFNLE